MMDKLLEVISALLPTVVTFGFAYYVISAIVSVILIIVALIMVINIFARMNKKNRF